MYTTCSNIICCKIFLGNAYAFTIENKPLCGACYNDKAFFQPMREGKTLITDRQIHEAMETLRTTSTVDPNDWSEPPMFPPPTMG